MSTDSQDCPECGATDQTGEYCEQCGVRIRTEQSGWEALSTRKKWTVVIAGLLLGMFVVNLLDRGVLG
ncbi:hypothetical protein [Salinarchaeum chitinilyticum]